MKNADDFYMGVALAAARQSYALKRQVGVVAVKGPSILDFSYNGTLPGADNTCERELPDGRLETLPGVLHAEEHLLIKLARRHGGAAGATFYCTLSPCEQCARMMAAAGIAELVYMEEHKTAGLELLESYLVPTRQYVLGDGSF